MIRRKSNVLIQIECRYLTEIETLLFMPFDHFAVQPHRSAARCQPQHRIRFRLNQAGYNPSANPTALFRRFLNNNFHN